MNENIQKFLEKFLSDEALQAKFSALKTPDEAYELAKSLQDGFTREEFLEAVQKLSALDEADITDEDLAAAAGGETEAPAQNTGEENFTPPSIPTSVKVSGMISGITEKGATAVSDAISNVTGAATKAIKNALP